MAKRRQTEGPRQCQPCTGCCDGWVSMLVYGNEVFPGQPCPYSTGEGCRIYEDRPVDPCQNFNCGWIQPDSDLPDWMRPDLAKIIVLPDMLVWQGLPVDVAVPIGRRIPGRALNFLRQRAQASNRLLIYTENRADEHGAVTREQEVVAYGPPEFQEAVAQKFGDGGLW